MSRDKDAVVRELLAMRCRRGDRMALEELIRTWERPLLYFIRRLVHDEADAWDVLQKTWVKVLSGISSLDDPRSLAPWLYRVARNTAFSHARSLELPHESLTDYPDASAADLVGGRVEFEDTEQVHRGLLSLFDALLPRGPVRGGGRGHSRRPAGHCQVPPTLRQTGPA